MQHDTIHHNILANPIVLGIETSCDETAAAVVTSDKRILSNVVYTQYEEHKLYQGVVPEIAARSHLQKCQTVIQTALRDAHMSLSDITAVAATTGPGLIGGLLVGMQMAKSLAWTQCIPFIAVNHLQAHALTVRLSDTVAFPFLLLLVSGGHTQILQVNGVNQYIILGETFDDAVGEAFDKIAKILQVGYPGGPAIEKRAKKGDYTQIKLPIPLQGKKNCDFSLSGLKTRVRQLVQQQSYLSPTYIDNMCAAFQHAVAMHLQSRVIQAFAVFKRNTGLCHPPFVVAGGVASNMYIRDILATCARQQGFHFYVAPVPLCTDNGAMIAWAGIEMLQNGGTHPQNLTVQLHAPAHPRWGLQDMSI